MTWSPRSGARQLCREYPESGELLCQVLTGKLSARDLASDASFIPLLQGLGGRHALNALKDATGTRLGHWPRVWAARALAITGDPSCAHALITASEDSQWRVRMQAVRAAGLVTNSETVSRIADRLVSDINPRVRQAVALAISRKGNSQSSMLLGELGRDADVSVRQVVARAEH